MTISDWLVILAIVAAPILAVQIQKRIENYRQKRQRKLEIFKTLMATRGTPIAPTHVQALNMIDIEFYGKREEDEKVISAWSLYLDHLYNNPKDVNDPNYKTKYESWTEKSKELLTELLFEMGESLNYKFDKVRLKRATYNPEAHATFELETSFIRRKFIDILLGKSTFPVSISKEKTEELEQESDDRIK